MPLLLINTIKKISRIPISELPTRIRFGLKRKIFSTPSNILIQTTAACNLKCEHCFINYYGDIIPNGKIRLLDINEFKATANAIKRMIKNARFMQFSTFEPLLNKHIFNMMDYALEINPNLQFYIHSNAMIIDEKIIENLEKRPIAGVTISLDGATKDTVEKFKTGSDFDKIIKNIKLLADSNLKDKISLVFVLHKSNQHELLDYSDFVKELGIRNIHINNLMPFLPEFENEVLYAKEGNPDVEKLFEKLAVRIKKNKQVAQIPTTKPLAIGCNQCNALYIDVDGNVSPCDYLAVSTPFSYFGKTQQLPPLIFGNIFKTNVEKIYNSKEYKAFRRFHLKGDIPQHCKFCINSYNLLCSNRKTIK